MGLFGNLGTDGLEEKEDRIGGGSWVRETGVYDMEIKVAYAGKSQKGAQFVDFTFINNGDGGDGKEYRETFYVTNQKGENWFAAKDKEGKPTGKKRALPGFEHVNDICLVTCEKELSEMADEEKTVNVWDPDAKKQLPKSVPVLVELTGKRVFLAIQKSTENKTQNVNGTYEPIADTRDVNTVEKVAHHPSKMTVLEAQQEKTEAAFIDAWAEANNGKTKDKRSIKDGQAGQSGRPGRAASGPPAAGNNSDAPARTSLFGKK